MSKCILALLLALPAFAVPAHDNSQKLAAIDELHTFAFGSCNEQWSPQPLWKHISALNPQLFIWGGDAIYSDTRNTRHMAVDYLMQDTVPEYQAFTQRIPIIGVWDDHDYGFNNANYSNPIKQEAQRMFLDFIKVPQNSFLRKQQGVYSAHTFGSGDRTVKLILLDMRYHMKSPGADILGQEQWQFLEREIAGSKAKLHFILGGYSLLGRPMHVSEELSDYPKAYKRLHGLIAKHKPAGTVFLTGDKHFSSIFQRNGQIEFMSSGMTHTVPNSMVYKRYIKRFFPFAVYGKTFGLVRIRWQGTTPALSLEIWGQSRKPIASRNYNLINNSWVLQRSKDFPDERKPQS